jgi:hypothetical protein
VAFFVMVIFSDCISEDASRAYGPQPDCATGRNGRQLKFPEIQGVSLSESEGF